MSEQILVETNSGREERISVTGYDVDAIQAAIREFEGNYKEVI